MCPLIIHGQTIREKGRLSVTRFFFFTVWKCRILIAAGEGNATLLSTSILFSASSIFFLMDHLTKPCLSSPRQSWWQTRVISNRLDILPEQHPLWENHPKLGHAPIILYFLQPSVPQFPVLTRSWKSWTPCLRHPFSHPAEAGCGTDGGRQGSDEGRSLAAKGS